MTSLLKLAAEFEALADRAAVKFPERLDIQAAACALLGRWALDHRTEISRALGGAVGDEWRGIETHDGSTGSVLVWMPGWPCGFEAKWHPDHKGWWLAGSDPTDYYDGQCEPTHWRPLPPPPSALKPQGGEE